MAPSIWQLLILLLVVVLVFGTKKLRNVGKDLGGAIHDFKQGLNEGATDNKTPAAKETNETRDNDKAA